MVFSKDVSIVEVPPQTSSSFLNLPSQLPQESRLIDIKNYSTSVDEKRTIHPASEERLKIIRKLQKFETPDWKEVRYSSALKSFLASPAFVDLKSKRRVMPF